MKWSVLIGGVIASAVALPAAAQFYVGGGFGQSKAKDWCANAGGISCDDRDTAWKAFGGYQFNRNFAAELGYTNLGEFKASAGGLTDNAKVNAWELSALAAWPFMNQFAVYGRLGAYRANVKEETNFVGNFEHSNTDLTYGWARSTTSRATSGCAWSGSAMPRWAAVMSRSGRTRATSPTSTCWD